MKKTKKAKNVLHTMVRDDLEMLTLSAPVDETGMSVFSGKQMDAMAAFHKEGHHDFEWLHWIVFGRSQRGGPLRGKFLKLHKDLMNTVKTLPIVEERAWDSFCERMWPPKG